MPPTPPVSDRSRASLRNEVRRIVAAIASSLAIVWLIEGVDVLMPELDLDRRMAIHPRDLRGLAGVLTYPFAHGDFGHLISNSIGWCMLGGLVAAHSLRELSKVVAWSVLVSGLAIWSISPANSLTIGASGVVFGCFGYLVVRGWVTRNVGSLLLSIGVAIVHGSMLFGMVPGVGPREVSWQAHLFGFVGGAIAAWRLARLRRSRARA